MEQASRQPARNGRRGFHFTGPCGDNGWLEDSIARVDNKPLGRVVF